MCFVATQSCCGCLQSKILETDIFCFTGDESSSSSAFLLFEPVDLKGSLEGGIERLAEVDCWCVLGC